MPSKKLIGNPRITEKAERMKSQNKFVFVVSRDAVKSEIKKLIQKNHKVEVMAVNIVRRGNEKKAIVTLKAGQTINEKV
jgi:ribosomal protein L23